MQASQLGLTAAMYAQQQQPAGSRGHKRVSVEERKNEGVLARAKRDEVGVDTAEVMRSKVARYEALAREGNDVSICQDLPTTFLSYV